MKMRIATKAFVSSWMGLTVQRDPKRTPTKEKIEETMLNQLKSISIPYVLPTIWGLEPKLKNKFGERRRGREWERGEGERNKREREREV